MLAEKAAAASPLSRRHIKKIAQPIHRSDEYNKVLVGQAQIRPNAAEPRPVEQATPDHSAFGVQIRLGLLVRPLLAVKSQYSKVRNRAA